MYETSGMTVYKEVDGKLVIVANFEQGMDDDMNALLNNAALLEALEGLLNYSFWPDKPEVHLEFMSAEERVAYEAIRKAKEKCDETQTSK